MTWKNLVSHTYIVTASIFASLAGLITFECASLAAYSQQPPTQRQNNPTIHTANKTIFANALEEVSLQKNMAYREARKLLNLEGWKPNLQGEPPNLNSLAVKELFDLGYKEIKDCAGTGEAPCRFEFINDKGEVLVVVATTRGYENTKRFVQRWWIEKNSNITQQIPSQKIASGFYSLGGTDQGLEVQGKRYRYYDELGTKPWQSISDLQYVTNGVVFDGRNYWCLSTLAPRNKPAACSANGWIQATLPFLGTRFFNFLGGSGTGQSITIKNDGTAIVKIHGTMNTSVLYQGKFVNPMKLEDGFRLLFKDDKVYQLTTDGQIAKGCKKEGQPCVSELYQP